MLRVLTRTPVASPDTGAAGTLTGARTEALTHVETLMQILADHPQIDISVVNWELFAIYLTCYEILQQANDPRASIVLKNGDETLQSQAAQIDAPELRHSFLENILVHRQLVAAWQADVGMNSTGRSTAQETLPLVGQWRREEEILD